MIAIAMKSCGPNFMTPDKKNFLIRFVYFSSKCVRQTITDEQHRVVERGVSISNAEAQRADLVNSAGCDAQGQAGDES